MILSRGWPRSLRVAYSLKEKHKGTPRGEMHKRQFYGLMYGMSPRRVRSFAIEFLENSREDR